MRASRGLNSASGGARLWTAQLTHWASPPPALRVRDCHPGEQQAQTLLRTLETSHLPGAAPSDRSFMQGCKGRAAFGALWTPEGGPCSGCESSPSLRQPGFRS